MSYLNLNDKHISLPPSSSPPFSPLCLSDLKPLSVEVGEASSLRLLGAEKENAELRRRLENLQAEQEVRGRGCQSKSVKLICLVNSL